MKIRHATESPYTVLLSPVVTEKSTTLAEGESASGMSYVFNVTQDATKTQIRKAVEVVFSVTVAKVRVHNVKGKARNLRHRSGGRRSGHKPTQRRAFVRVAAGDNIDFWKFGGAET